MNNRLKITALLVAVLVPLTMVTHVLSRPYIHAMINPSERQEVREKLDQALKHAASNYRSRHSVEANEEEIAEAKQKLKSLNTRKVQLEEQIERNNLSLSDLKERFGITMLLHGAG